MFFIKNLNFIDFHIFSRTRNPDSYIFWGLEVGARTGNLSSLHPWVLFSALRSFSQKLKITQHTHNTFSLQMSQIPERSRSKTSTAFNCFIQPASPWIIYVAPPPTIRLHSLLSFTHSLVSGIVRPLSLKLPFTPSIHLLFGLPLPLLPY